MARKGREAALKRSREKARQERQEAKRERRAERRAENAETEVDEQALMEEYARLAERHEAGEIKTAEYEEERARILEELGIEL
ncbi:MAG: hypothetical protein J5I28_00265 [Acidimicrobiales bacterium]|jgi:hypothetical protein|nr:hypothetical protein [Acidimicrobiales bacterium]HLV90315.1 hypothetical protein [Acidimicrobiia bacterium]